MLIMSETKYVVNDRDYSKHVSKAVKFFWNTKKRQLKDSGDASNRAAVVGGKQMDGFIDLLKRVAIDAGVPTKCIITDKNFDAVNKQVSSLYDNQTAMQNHWAITPIHHLIKKKERQLELAFDFA